MAKGPLNNVKILDLTHVWAGPLATRILGDLGAQVVKIEAPMGRGPTVFPVTPLGGFIGGSGDVEPWNNSAVFVKLQRNKRSVALDLKEPSGRDVFLALVAEADIVIENFSARALARLALDYPLLSAVNPGIIHVAMPGYGLTGPYRERVAFGPTVEPMCGLTSTMGYSETEPRATAMALPDPIAAVNATAAVMTALRKREQTGLGCQVEMSLHEAAVSYSGPWLLEHQLGGSSPRIGNRHPEMAPHGVYPCRDEDRWVAIACRNDAEWFALSKLLDRADGHAWNLATRLVNHDEIDVWISSWTECRPCEEAFAALSELGIPAGTVNDTAAMTADAHVQARGFFVPLERDTPIPGNPIKMSAISPQDWTPCPKLGVDNETVLRDWLGYSDEAIDALYAEQILVNQPPH